MSGPFPAEWGLDVVLLSRRPGDPGTSATHILAALVAAREYGRANLVVIDAAAEGGGPERWQPLLSSLSFPSMYIPRPARGGRELTVAERYLLALPHCRSEIVLFHSDERPVPPDALTGMVDYYFAHRRLPQRDLVIFPYGPAGARDHFLASHAAIQSHWDVFESSEPGAPDAAAQLARSPRIAPAHGLGSPPG
jgi:hypothetical protein